MERDRPPDSRGHVGGASGAQLGANWNGPGRQVARGTSGAHREHIGGIPRGLRPYFGAAAHLAALAGLLEVSGGRRPFLAVPSGRQKFLGWVLAPPSSACGPAKISGGLRPPPVQFPFEIATTFGGFSLAAAGPEGMYMEYWLKSSWARGEKTRGSGNFFLWSGRFNVHCSG